MKLTESHFKDNYNTLDVIVDKVDGMLFLYFICNGKTLKIKKTYRNNILYEVAEYDNGSNSKDFYLYSNALYFISDVNELDYFSLSLKSIVNRIYKF